MKQILRLRKAGKVIRATEEIKPPNNVFSTVSAFFSIEKLIMSPASEVIALECSAQGLMLQGVSLGVLHTME